MYNLAALACYSENEGHFLFQVAGGVKVCWSQALFFQILNFFRTIDLEQRIWHYRVSVVKKNWMILNFAKKKQQQQNLTSV